VSAGKLREDLLYRLNVFPIPLPPLRERGDDVELLADHFLAELNAAEGKSKHLTPPPASGSAATTGRATSASSRTSSITPSSWRTGISGSRSSARRRRQEASEEPHHGRGHPSRGRGTRLILAALDQFDGDKKKVASALQISVATLYTRLNEYKSH
jgi:transcriptional regulator with PAS, ATPase and Fis domain